MPRLTISVHVDETALVQSVRTECIYTYTCLHCYIYLHRSLPVADVDVELVPEKAKVQRTIRTCNVEGIMYAW